jgi:hypothetical protein
VQKNAFFGLQKSFFVSKICICPFFVVLLRCKGTEYFSFLQIFEQKNTYTTPKKALNILLNESFENKAKNYSTTYAGQKKYLLT